MTEERKHAILLAATILCARKMMPLLEEDAPNMAQEFWAGHYAKRASKILEKIDERWPSQ